jgi:elongation factor 1-alpha
MNPGQNIVFAPSTTATDVKSVGIHHTALLEAVPGDNIGFNMTGIAAGDIRREYVVGETARDLPVQRHGFTARMIIGGHARKIRAGYQPVFDCRTA